MLYLLTEAPDSTDAGWAESCQCRNIVCPAGHNRPGPLTTPLEVVADTEQDFLWSTMELLVSDRVRDTLCQGGITGFRTEPVPVVIMDTGKLVTMRQVIVTGWGGILPETELQDYCPLCEYQEYRTDARALQSYRGPGDAHLFTVWPFPLFPLATRQVADLIKREGWTGVRAKPLSKVVTVPDQRPGDPGRWLSEAAVQEIRSRLLRAS